MKKLVLAGVLASTLAVPAISQATPIHECGNLYRAGIYNLTTRNFTCRDARFIVTSANGMATFKCRTHASYEIADTRCTRPGGVVIRYQTGD